MISPGPNRPSGYQNLMRDRATSEIEVGKWADFLDQLLHGNRVGIKTYFSRQNETVDFTEGTQAGVEVQPSKRLTRNNGSVSIMDIYRVSIWTGEKYIPIDEIEWIEEMKRPKAHSERRAPARREYSRA